MNFDVGGNKFLSVHHLDFDRTCKSVRLSVLEIDPCEIQRGKLSNTKLDLIKGKYKFADTQFFFSEVKFVFFKKNFEHLTQCFSSLKLCISSRHNRI